MRGLTDEEATFLSECLPPIDLDDLGPLTEAEEDLWPRLRRRGCLLLVDEYGEDGGHFVTTERGRIAIQIHQAIRSGVAA